MIQDDCLWDMILRDLAGAYQHLNVTCCLHLQGRRSYSLRLSYPVLNARLCDEDDRYYSEVGVWEHGSVKVADFVTGERLLDPVLGVSTTD